MVDMEVKDRREETASPVAERMKTSGKMPTKAGLGPRQREKIGDFLCIVPALVLLMIFVYYPIAKLFQSVPP